MEAQKPIKKRRFSIRKLILFVFLIIILILIGISEIGPVTYDKNYSGPHPEPVYNRSLSESEMALPFDGYRRDFVGERSIKVNYPAPIEKPVIQWSRKFMNPFPDKLVTDNKGGTLYFEFISPLDEDYPKTSDLDPKRPIRILRKLKPDNTISWKRYYDWDREYIPVSVCNGAVVWLIKSWSFRGFSPDYKRMVSDFFKVIFGIPFCEASLECVDNDGNVVWRTQKEKIGTEHFFWGSAWRISGNRIMMPTGRFNSGTFNIFSLSDGKLLESVKFSGWNSGSSEYGPLSPIEIPGKGWIGFQRSGIVLFGSSMKKIWKYGIPIKKFRSQPYILGDRLIVSTVDYIEGIDIESGKMVWTNADYASAVLKIAEKDENVLFFTTNPNAIEFPYFNAIDNNGKLLISNLYQVWDPKGYPYSSSFIGDIYTVVYKDGKILMYDNKWLGLFEKNGAAIWRMNLEELGFSSKSDDIEQILWAPDNRLVLYMRAHSTSTYSGGRGEYVVSLKFNNGEKIVAQ